MDINKAGCNHPVRTVDDRQFTALAPTACIRGATDVFFQLGYSAFFNQNSGGSILSGGSFNGTVSGGLSSVGDAGEIGLRAGDLYEMITFNRPVSFKLKGGYGSDFLSVAGATTIHGSISIADGTVNFENIVIMQ